MAKHVQIKGVAEVNAALKRQGVGIKKNALAGLYSFGLKVRRLAQQRVPIEKGILKASAYTRPGEDKMSIDVGFSADYAWYVHENLEQKLKGKPRPSRLGVYWGPAGQPKYLESSLNELRSQLAPDVAGEVRSGLNEKGK